MKTRSTLVAVTAFALAALSAPALTARTTAPVVKVAEPASSSISVTPAGYAQPAQPSGFSAETGLPSIAEIDRELERDGDHFGWIDADGAPLTLERVENDILVRRPDGVTSKITVSEMSGAETGLIGTAVVATAD